MVFIITSPFPFHFLYKLAQVPCCVPERAHQRQPAEMHLQTHHSGALSSLLTQLSPSFAFLQPTHSSSPFCLLHLHVALLDFSLFSFLHSSLFCLSLFSYFPLFSPLPFILFFLTKHYPTAALRISLLFHKLWITQGHISKTQHETDPWREGNKE